MMRRAALPFSVSGLVAGTVPCTWIQDTDYRGVNNTNWRVGENMTKEDCCELCQQTEGCDFTVWNPDAKSCWHKTLGAVPFHKPGDLTCCPKGSRACPAADDGWHLLPEFSDEFPVDASHGDIIPLNLTKWNTAPTSPDGWTWSAGNVQVVSALPSGAGKLQEVPGSYLALTAQYSEHERDGKTYCYTSGIATTSLPSGVSFGRFEAKIRSAGSWSAVSPMLQLSRRSNEHEGYAMKLDMSLGQGLGGQGILRSAWHVLPPTAGLEEELVETDQQALPFDPRADFHIYGLEWNTSTLTWRVDDQVVWQEPSAPFFDQGWPLDVSLSLPVNEVYLQTPCTSEASEAFPATFYVDWLRVWQTETAII